MMFFFGFASFVKQTFAVTLSIDSFPPTITDQPFTIELSLTGAQAGINYLRVDLYKEGTNNYFGETFVDPDWYSGSVGEKYLPVKIPDTNTVVKVTIQARIGNPSKNDFPGQGLYRLKVRRYTESGSQGDLIGDFPEIQIDYSFPTPTPMPTSTPRPTPTPTHIPTPTRSPTSTPIPTQILKTPTPTLFKDVSIAGVEGELPSAYPTAVLGTSSKVVSPTSIIDRKDIMEKNSSTAESISLLTLVLCGVGGGLLCGCGILLYLKRRRGEI